MPRTHGAALCLPQAVQVTDSAGAGPGDHQPGLLAAGPADFPPRYRRVRNPLPGIFDRRVLPRRQPAARRGGRRRLRLARRQELSGLRHQSHHPATRRAALRRRHPAFARSALLDVRGPAERGNARQAAEGPDRRRAPDSRLDQRAVHVAGRRHLRDGVRVHRALADRAGLFRDRPAARHPQLGAEPQDQGDPEDRSSPRRPPWPDRRPSRSATSSW